MESLGIYRYVLTLAFSHVMEFKAPTSLRQSKLNCLRTKCEKEELKSSSESTKEHVVRLAMVADMGIKTIAAAPCTRRNVGRQISVQNPLLAVGETASHITLESEQ